MNKKSQNKKRKRKDRRRAREFKELGLGGMIPGATEVDHGKEGLVGWHDLGEQQDDGEGERGASVLAGSIDVYKMLARYRNAMG